ncbi:receptor-type tyrosine-protein phosphatase C isoform X4 [Scyliorhinus canicula]|uniref:receptor-type tyrosine-protein phosphatase C isoform X4 n=1 Tax=Scyliorhinus canicula TaxID=7830 RepID=UPI0018F6A8E7|nr:receptor-type tyrosine-protein phosphatase C isoform X4 [Scyliorhinus canicula]
MSKFSWLKYLALAAALLGATVDAQVSPTTVAPTTSSVASTAADHSSLTTSSMAPTTVTTAFTPDVHESTLRDSSTAPQSNSTAPAPYVTIPTNSNTNSTVIPTRSETSAPSEGTAINDTTTGFLNESVTSAPIYTTSNSTTPSGDENCANITAKRLSVTSNNVTLNISYTITESQNITILNKLILLDENKSSIIESLVGLDDCTNYNLMAIFSGKCRQQISLANITTGPPPDLQFELTKKQSEGNIIFKLNQQHANCGWKYTWNCTSPEGSNIENQENQEIATFYNITPCKDYICSLNIQHNSTNWTQTVTGNITAEYEEPNEPTFELASKEKSIDVTWNFIVTKQKAVTSVKITCSPEVKYEDRNQEVRSDTVRSGVHTFYNLTPYAKYTVTVNVSNKCTEGGVLSNWFTKQIETQVGVPKKPESELSLIANNAIKLKCTKLKDKDFHGPESTYFAKVNEKVQFRKNSEKCEFVFEDLSYLTTYKVELIASNGKYNSSSIDTITTKYNDKALIGFLVFLIITTSIALAIVLYKIYVLQRKSSRHSEESVELIEHDDEKQLLNVEPILAEHLIDEYRRKHADESRLFLAEFQSIPRVFSKFNSKEARRGCNSIKNRYIDILPYDHNRVQLTPVPGAHGSDYINASFIDGFNESRKYIAAQGPKEETSNDFWKMVWEQKATIIVMVTRCEEGKRPKCAQYWPNLDETSKPFGDIAVRIGTEKWCPDYVIRKLYISNQEKGPEREVTHIQFIRWPDHGVPEDPHLLLKLRQRVNAFRNLFSGPIVVHCSAGVGRTGSYIGIDAMMQGLETEGRVDIYGYIVQLRRQRCLMVQVETQYILIHQALLEYYLYGETEVNLSELPKHLTNFKKNDPPTEPSLLEIEFQKIPPYTDWRSQSNGRRGENQTKNYSLSVIPYDYNRVTIKLEGDRSKDSESHSDSDLSSDESEDEESLKYINASYIDGYWHDETLIATQTPLTGTIADFWMLVYQRKARIIAVLGKLKDDKDCVQYWEDGTKTYDDIEVKLADCIDKPTYIVREFEIRHTKRKETRKVYQYHFHSWSESEIPEDPDNLVNMITTIKEKLSPLKVAEDITPPLIVHCRDGSKQTGVFCALWNLLDSASTENLIDVLQTVKALRKQRTGMLLSFAQYQFLYDTIASTYPVQNGTLISDNGPSETTLDIISETNPENKSQQSTAYDSAKNKEVSSEEDEAKSSSSNDKQPAENPINGPVTSGEIA